MLLRSKRTLRALLTILTIFLSTTTTKTSAKKTLCYKCDGNDCDGDQGSMKTCQSRTGLCYVGFEEDGTHKGCYDTSPSHSDGKSMCFGNLCNKNTDERRHKREANKKPIYDKNKHKKCFHCSFTMTYKAGDNVLLNKSFTQLNESLAKEDRMYMKRDQNATTLDCVSCTRKVYKKFVNAFDLVGKKGSGIKVWPPSKLVGDANFNSYLFTDENAKPPQLYFYTLPFEQLNEPSKKPETPCNKKNKFCEPDKKGLKHCLVCEVPKINPRRHRCRECPIKTLREPPEDKNANRRKIDISELPKNSKDYVFTEDGEDRTSHYYKNINIDGVDDVNPNDLTTKCTINNNFCNPADEYVRYCFVCKKILKSNKLGYSMECAQCDKSELSKAPDKGVERVIESISEFPGVMLYDNYAFTDRDKDNFRYYFFDNPSKPTECRKENKYCAPKGKTLDSCNVCEANVDSQTKAICRRCKKNDLTKEPPEGVTRYIERANAVPLVFSRTFYAYTEKKGKTLQYFFFKDGTVECNQKNNYCKPAPDLIKNCYHCVEDKDFWKDPRNCYKCNNNDLLSNPDVGVKRLKEPSDETPNKFSNLVYSFTEQSSSWTWYYYFDNPNKKQCNKENNYCKPKQADIINCYVCTPDTKSEYGLNCERCNKNDLTKTPHDETQRVQEEPDDIPQRYSQNSYVFSQAFEKETRLYFLDDPLKDKCNQLNNHCIPKEERVKHCYVCDDGKHAHCRKCNAKETLLKPPKKGTERTKDPPKNVPDQYNYINYVFTERKKKHVEYYFVDNPMKTKCEKKNHHCSPKKQNVIECYVCEQNRDAIGYEQCKRCESDDDLLKPPKKDVQRYKENPEEVAKKYEYNYYVFTEYNKHTKRLFFLHNPYAEKCGKENEYCIPNEKDIVQCYECTKKAGTNDDPKCTKCKSNHVLLKPPKPNANRFVEPADELPEMLSHTAYVFTERTKNQVSYFFLSDPHAEPSKPRPTKRPTPPPMTTPKPKPTQKPKPEKCGKSNNFCLPNKDDIVGCIVCEKDKGSKSHPKCKKCDNKELERKPPKKTNRYKDPDDEALERFKHLSYVFTENIGRKVKYYFNNKEADNDADKDNAGKDNADKDNEGKDNADKDNEGKDNADKDNEGKDNADKDNEGKDNAEKDNADKDNADKDNEGKGKEDKDNEGKGNEDKDNEGKGKEDKDNEGKGKEDKDNEGKGKEDKDNEGKGKEDKPKEKNEPTGDHPATACNKKNKFCNPSHAAACYECVADTKFLECIKCNRNRFTNKPPPEDTERKKLHDQNLPELVTPDNYAYTEYHDAMVTHILTSNPFTNARKGSKCDSSSLCFVCKAQDNKRDNDKSRTCYECAGDSCQFPRTCKSSSNKCFLTIDGSKEVRSCSKGKSAYECDFNYCNTFSHCAPKIRETWLKMPGYTKSGQNCYECKMEILMDLFARNVQNDKKFKLFEKELPSALRYEEYLFSYRDDDANIHFFNGYPFDPSMFQAKG